MAGRERRGDSRHAAVAPCRVDDGVRRPGTLHTWRRCAVRAAARHAASARGARARPAGRADHHGPPSRPRRTLDVAARGRRAGGSAACTALAAAGARAADRAAALMAPHLGYGIGWVSITTSVPGRSFASADDEGDR